MWVSCEEEKMPTRVQGPTRLGTTVSGLVITPSDATFLQQIITELDYQTKQKGESFACLIFWFCFEILIQ